jgi:glycosyltransferase involved in cell wall biosynthesis
MKLVSVILPCFNAELYIAEAIQSILEQTYTNFELIVLDDGSTDNTKSVIRKFNDLRIKLYTENQNKGIVYQLNKGLKIANGEYIARMDADDISYPERIQKQVSFLEEPENRAIEILGTDAISIGLSQKRIIHQNYLPKQISFMLNFKCPILHPTVMMRSSILKKGFRYEEEYLFAEDFAMWRKLDNGSNIAILNEILLNYRIHNKQTNADISRLNTQIKSVKKVLEIRNYNSTLNTLNTIFLAGKKKAFIYTNKWLNSENVNGYKLNYITEIYIRLMKKYLKIKSELIYKIIE